MSILALDAIEIVIKIMLAFQVAIQQQEGNVKNDVCWNAFWQATTRSGQVAPGGMSCAPPVAPDFAPTSTRLARAPLVVVSGHGSRVETLFRSHRHLTLEDKRSKKEKRNDASRV